jgi:uncharacterized protein YecE (DUF72 family)
LALHVGTMGWSYGFWRGNFYPEGLSSREFLGFYGSRFGTVEVDGTFYRIPRRQSVIDWGEQTPEGFVFSLKFPRVVTHVKMLRDCWEETGVFLERVGVLGEKLGVLLLQFPYAFGVERVGVLRDFLAGLPGDRRYVVEVRNRKLLNEGLFGVLRDFNVVLAWVDSPFMPQISEVTSDFLYVRWEGDRRRVKGTLGRREVDRAESIRVWADRLKPFLDEQKTVFGYFSKYYSGHSPSDAMELLDYLHVGADV